MHATAASSGSGEQGRRRDRAESGSRPLGPGGGSQLGAQESRKGHSEEAREQGERLSAPSRGAGACRAQRRRGLPWVLVGLAQAGVGGPGPREGRA